jgi:hypothetical protein
VQLRAPRLWHASVRDIADEDVMEAKTALALRVRAVNKSGALEAAEIGVLDRPQGSHFGARKAAPDHRRSSQNVELASIQPVEPASDQGFHRGWCLVQRKIGRFARQSEELFAEQRVTAGVRDDPVPNIGSDGSTREFCDERSYVLRRQRLEFDDESCR